MSMPDHGCQSKRLATAQARCALLGATLYSLTSDRGHAGFVVSWRHLTRSFGTLAEVEAWIDGAEGGRG